MSDSPLIDKLATPPTRERVIDDCVRLIDREVAAKSGVRAMPIKGGYKVIQGVKPGFMGECVNALLDDFCRALDPFYARWADGADAGSRPPLADELKRQEEDVSNALLGVTDARAERAQNKTLLKLYRKLRGMAQNHVKAALPGLGRTIEPYVRD